MTKNNNSESIKNPEFRLQLMPKGNEVAKKLSEIEQTKPFQASLFEMLTETDVLTVEGSRNEIPGRNNYSQTIELYDFMPRFVWSHQADIRKEYNGLLPALVRDFQCRGTRFRLTLAPATLIKEGKSIGYYPGLDEDILEIVLRKMYVDRDPKFFDGSPGMIFTIRGLRKELKEQGHSRSHYQVIDSLRILKGAQINCQNLANGKETLFNAIDVLSFGNSDESGEVGADEPCYLIFSSLLAKALKNLYFRRFNYKKVVSYKTKEARLLHRRLSHNFSQSNENVPYSVNLTTLIRDFGLKYENLTKAGIAFKKAFKELRNANVIQPVIPANENEKEKLVLMDKIVSASNTRKVEDYFLTIKTTKAFSFEASNSNVIKNKIEELAEQVIEPEEKKQIQKKAKNSIFPTVNKNSTKDKK